MHGFCKPSKQQLDDFPPFMSILSALKTSTFNLAKFLVPILSPLTEDKCTVKESFQFA